MLHTYDARHELCAFPFIVRSCTYLLTDVAFLSLAYFGVHELVEIALDTTHYCSPLGQSHVRLSDTSGSKVLSMTTVLLCPNYSATRINDVGTVEASGGYDWMSSTSFGRRSNTPAGMFSILAMILDLMAVYWP